MRHLQPRSRCSWTVEPRALSWHPGTEDLYTGPVEAVFVLVMITIQPHESSGFVFARRLFACK